MSEIFEKFQLHDTHVHLDLLLEKMGLLDPKRFQPHVYENLEYWQDVETDGEILFQDLGVQKEEIQKVLFKQLAKHEFLIQSTISTSNFLKTRALLEKLHLPARIYYSLGSHPEILTHKFDLYRYLNEQEMILDNLLFILDKCVAIGEIGLDYYHTNDFELRQMQWTLFSRQIELAIQLDLPIIIHCREAFDDLFAILQDFPEIENRVLIHCFTGNYRDLEACLDIGAKIGIGGIITFGQSAEELRKVVSVCPDESFVLETDLPFLSPSPERGQICLPEKIVYTAEKLAQLKGYSVEKIWELSRNNAIELFDLDLPRTNTSF